VKRQPPNKRLIHLAIIGVLIFGLSGCSVQTRQKVLTFFFTGVPTIEERAQKKRAAEEEKKKKIEEIKKKKQLEALRAKNGSLPEEITKGKEGEPEFKLYSHTPYADGLCSQCHRSQRARANFRAFGKTAVIPRFEKGGGMPGVLIAPRKKICIKCHEFMSVEKASKKGLWLHTPAADGDCTTCHDSHQTNYPNVLLEKPAKICLKCHSDENMMEIKDHNEACVCLDCHNPHLGVNELMLKEDYQEEKYPVMASPASSDAKEVLPESGRKETQQKK
jgi:predicted CXXCH cytochrome family protein